MHTYIHIFMYVYYTQTTRVKERSNENEVEKLLLFFFYLYFDMYLSEEAFPYSHPFAIHNSLFYYVLFISLITNFI